MSLSRLGLGFSAPSHPNRRCCYVRPSALDQLLETPGAVELLLEELDATPSPSKLSLVEQLACLKQRAIHLSVTSSPFTGLSVEDIVVLAAYSSTRFDHTAWKHELLRERTDRDLNAACRAWLMQRVRSVASGQHLGLLAWPLVGSTPCRGQGPPELALGLAPIASARALERELEPLAAEASFAHEHYLACAPATALDYLSLRSHAGRSVRWDPFALERRLRGFGLGLLLVERDSVLLHLPGRFLSVPCFPAPL